MWCHHDADAPVIGLQCAMHMAVNLVRLIAPICPVNYFIFQHTFHYDHSTNTNTSLPNGILTQDGA